MEWSATVEFSVERPTITQAERMLEALAQHHPAGSVGPRTMGASLSIEAPDATSASRKAARLVLNAAKTAGIRAGEVVELEVMEWKRFERWLDTPTFPDLIGSAEAAEILGVSRQRFHEIRRTKDFPEPLAEVAATPLWVRGAVQNFIKTWNRKPGRPARVGPKHEAPADAAVR